MSKNNKNRRLHLDAKARNRVKGYKGPARTTKVNTKKRAWYQLKDANGVLLCMKEKPAKGGKDNRKSAS